jgi:AAA+ superfamily predicted ATPase
MNEKKIRWNIPKAMACVYQMLNGSKLSIKKTKPYTTAMENLKNLYNLTQTQTWLLCIICEWYFEEEESTSMKEISYALKVPVMTIMNWKAERDKLEERGFIEHRGRHDAVQPVSEFRESLINNIEFVPPEKREPDEIDFLNKFARLYENRRDDEKSSYVIKRELSQLESKNKNLEMIKRVCGVVSKEEDRFFLYDVTHDVLQGHESSLNKTIADLYDGSNRLSVAKKMMDETHALFQLGFLEFVDRGTLSDATVTLTDKGKKILLGDKAFLFEDAINDKNLIKTDSIKEKKLFYSEENQKEINRLKNALQDEKLKNIQQRLKDERLPVGVAILLYGAPGTGKTETVMQIAKETGRAIVHVDISEAKSAWFGESEKRIKKIFTSYKNACELAEKKGELMPILLFNEADALISKRKEDTSGNCAQTENAIQNIILEELENLKGIFIATTNLASNMDSAFERRFLFKIKFENPSTEAKTSIWMNKLTWLDKEAATEFARDYDFSGGQIDNIVRKIVMNEVITGERPAITEIHDMCKSEKLENPNGAKRVGFCL